MNKNSRDEGFSTIEALVAIALIAIAGAILVGASFVSIRSLNASKNAVFFAAKALSSDSAIRAAVGRVRIPWWERQVYITEETSSVSVPWLDGKANTSLVLYEQDGHLTIDSSEGVTIYKSHSKIESLSFGTIESIDGTPLGIEVHYLFEGTPVICSATFASRALGNK